MDNVLVIPDLHFPFALDCIPFLQYVYGHYQCSRVVCLGDELDMHSMSKFPADPDGLSPAYEFREGKEKMKELFSIFPSGDIVQSNHQMRPYKKAFLSGLPSDFLQPYQRALEMPDSWIFHDKIVIDDVLYFHGEGFSGKNGALTACEKYRRSVVIGHLHSFGGVTYLQDKISGKKIFGMNAGWLGDETQYVFKYAKNIPYAGTTGCGVVIKGKAAYFIPWEAYEGIY